MPARPKDIAEARKAAEWAAGIELRAAEGVLWNETAPVTDQLTDHFARLGLSDTTK